VQKGHPEEDTGSLLSMGTLAGKVSIVTGASRGIGRATSIQLAHLGSKVIAVARDEGALAELAAQATRMGGCVRPAVADVTALDQVIAVFDDTVRSYGRLDILVNNAGVLSTSTIADQSPADWQRVIDVNLTGAFYCLKCAARVMMTQRSGVIVTIGSRASHRGTKEFGAYCASKFGLLGLTESLAEEMKQHNVRVNMVCPDGVDTDMLRPFFTDVDRRELLSPKQIAEVVVFLCLPAASAITGACIDAYGLRPKY